MTDPNPQTPASEASPVTPTQESQPSPSASSTPQQSTPPDDAAVRAAAANLDPDIEFGDDLDDLTFLSTTTAAEAADPRQKPKGGGEDDDADDGIALPAGLQSQPRPVTPPAPLQTPVSSAPATPPTAPAAPAAPPAQVAQPPAPVAAAPAAQPPAQPAAQPQAAAPLPAAQPAPAAPAAPAGPDPFQVYQTWRQQGIDTLAKTDFALSEKDREAYEDDPAGFLPVLAARHYMTTVENCVAAVQQMVPHLITQVLEQNKIVEKNNEEFFGKYPLLKDHHAQVLEIGRQWRGLNPKASKDDFVKYVGPLAHQMLGIAMAAAAPAQQAPRTIPLPPHTPGASNGAAPRAPAASAQPTNIFEAMYMAPEPEEG